MSLACPSCGRTIAIKDAKPGRFRVPCPECGRPFRLEVGDGPDPALVATPIEASPHPPAPIAEAGPAAADSIEDARRVGARILAAMAERAGWAWRSLIHRGSNVGGALVLRELGRTSLGQLARGRQVLLGRDVLIRTMPADWGGPDPVARARAYRLAEISAEVIHPNLLRRLAFGEDRRRRYAIEEAAEGETLATLSARENWPGGDAAVAPVLHAARGLLAAHEQGLTHGDPSPEHIWVDEDGTVRLAGIGLAEPPGSATRDGAEPFPLSAARDVQTLGATLDTLTLPRKEGHGRGPTPLRQTIGRMRAAGTPDGFKDLSEAILALESCLDPRAAAPTADDARGMGEIVGNYHDLPLKALRGKLMAGFFGVCLAFTILFGLGGRFAMALGVLGLGGMTAALYGLIRAGLGHRPGLFGKLREWVLGGRRADWLTLVATGVGAIVVLSLLGWLAGWIALGVVAALFAIGLVVGVDAPIERERRATLEEARDLLRSMRARGVAELTIREFACRSGGDRWEDLFEALFGLDETRRARLAWGDAHPARLRIGAWRYRVLDWLDARLRDRREARMRAMFEPVEEAALVAQKVNEMTARRKSRRVAEALLIVAREVRATSLARLIPGGSDAIAVVPRPIPDLIREAVETPDKLLTSTWSDDREAERGPNPLLRLLAALIGPRARFLLGLGLVALFLLWADQVGIISSTEIRAQAERAIAERDVGRLKDVNVDVGRIHTTDEPLHIPGVPESLTRLVSGYGVGAAGLILIASALASGWRMALFALPAAAIAWLGPRIGIPAIGPLAAAAVAAAIGAGVLVVGLLWEGRR